MTWPTGLWTMFSGPTCFISSFSISCVTLTLAVRGVRVDLTPGKSNKKCCALSIGEELGGGTLFKYLVWQHVNAHMYVHTHTFISRHLICLT